MIGFVIPSIGRDTITHTLNSLINQTSPNWKCFVGFDGKEESDVDKSLLVLDERIHYFYLKDKLGNEGNHHGNAGQVRNTIISKTDNIDWIGFVDDDDSLSPNYVKILEREIEEHPFDCCVFRMKFPDGKILPPFEMNELRQNYVGISFCVSKNFIDTNEIKFENNNAEDFLFLKQIHQKGGKIVLSSHVTYYVNH